MRIVGERAVLRDRRASDLADLARWMQPGLKWQRWDAPWEPVTPGQAPDPRDLEALLERERSQEPRRRLAIDTVDGRHIGLVSWYWVDEGSQWADLGITIYEDAEWSHGIGSEAFCMWADYVLASTGWPRVGFGTWSGNHRMIRIGERLGFLREASFRNARRVDGVRYNAVRYGLLREEWERAAWRGSSERREA